MARRVMRRLIVLFLLRWSQNTHSVRSGVRLQGVWLGVRAAANVDCSGSLLIFSSRGTLKLQSKRSPFVDVSSSIDRFREDIRLGGVSRSVITNVAVIFRRVNATAAFTL